MAKKSSAVPSPGSWNCLWQSTAHCRFLPVSLLHCPENSGITLEGGFEIVWNCSMWHSLPFIHKHQKVNRKHGSSLFPWTSSASSLTVESTGEVANSSQRPKRYGQFVAHCSWYRYWFCMFNITWYRKPNSVFRDDLDGWEGGPRERGYIYIYIYNTADSHCAEETNTTLLSNYTPIKNIMCCLLQKNMLRKLGIWKQHTQDSESWASTISLWCTVDLD